MPTTVTSLIVLEWLEKGIFKVEEIESGILILTQKGKILTQRINTRNRMDDGDPRVDLCYKNCRRSIHVSHLVWMFNTRQAIPKGFEIHHLDEDPRNNKYSNLLCVHPLDHQKFHNYDEVPF